MYAEYIDDEKTMISVKKCLEFDCPLAFINNKGVLQQNMFPFFLSLVNPMPGYKLYTLIFEHKCRYSLLILGNVPHSGN